MARRDRLSSEAKELQAGLDRSWAVATRTLRDRPLRTYLVRSIARVNESSAELLGRDRFLEQTA